MIFENLRCLACNSDNLEQIVDFNNQPLANEYVKHIDGQRYYPLKLNLCNDCFHLQLSHSVSETLIYPEYIYETGTTKTIQDYCNWFAEFLIEYSKPKYYTVLDIGCNDGTQLNFFLDRKFKTYGIDPAIKFYKKSSEKHSIVCDFFPSNQTPKVSYDYIIAQNVMAHNKNPGNFLAECKELMNDETLLFVQTSQANMILNFEFDTVYHEHINYFNINSMKILASRIGINLVDVIKSNIHGVSYIFVFSKKLQRNLHIENLIALEHRLLTKETYIEYQKHVINFKNQFKEILQEYRNKNYQIIGFGASAKGNTLLNYCKELLDYIIDENKLKQDLLTPGMHIPITDLKILNNDKLRPILFLPLAWNFLDEIKNKIKSIRDNSDDKILHFFPTLKVSDV